MLDTQVLILLVWEARVNTKLWKKGVSDDIGSTRADVIVSCFVS